MFTRYAIYFTPPEDSDLARFGAAWLGWDSARASDVSHPDAPGVDLAEVTATPRKYGFHGTIKPPMHLAEGMSPDALAEDLEQFVRGQQPVTLEGLKLARLGRFLALVPVAPSAALAELAGQTVQAFDAYRAPPGEAELAKRRKSGLSPAQEANLEQWGYPYVFDEFRFHLTLSGRLAPDVLERTEAAAEQALGEIDLSPFVIDGLTLLGQSEDGRFHQIHRYALTG